MTLAAAAASLSMSVGHREPAPAAPVPPLGHTCAPLPYSGGADVVLDLAGAVAPVQTVRVRTGQTLGVGGRGGCDPYHLPPTAGPLLQEVARHTSAGGDLDVEYLALAAGTVTLPLCASACTPAAVVVTVLPAGDRAQAARRGTGTITLTGAGFAGTHPLEVDCPNRVRDGAVDAGPAFRFTAAGVAFSGVVNAGIRTVGEHLSRPAQKGNVVLGAGSPAHAPMFLIEYPRSGTLSADDGGGTLTAAPLLADGISQDWGTVALAWHC